MKILAIEREVVGAGWDDADELLREEARHVFELYLSGALREIYFTEKRNAVLVLESKDGPSATKLLDSLPLVEAGMIRFDVMELRPYDGYERLMGG